jgi:crotonobetainyl-CoA:carnitine CoA-transferase CaiB-like acyl-CoA transferase
VYTIDQLIEDPHVCDRDILFEVPDEEMGTVTMHAVTPRLSRSPGSVRMPAPALGEHTAELLERVGITGEALECLRAAGAA